MLYPFSDKKREKCKKSKIQAYTKQINHKTEEEEGEGEAIEGLSQIGLPVLGIVAVAAVTFYAVSFAELREKSFRELEEREDDDVGFKLSMSSRKRKAQRLADKQRRNKS